MSSSTPSGVYNITLESGNVMSAYCDMDTLGGRWTVIQKRYDGSLNFYKSWEEYKQGFGDLNFEFWLGNENMHLLTSSGSHELRIEMEDVDGNAYYASYNSFSVDGESSDYLLSVSGFSGDVFKDQMQFNDYTRFSTKDSDNDDYSTQDCAENLQGGWWYAACGTSNLNGAYNPSHSSDETAMHWRELTDTSPYCTTLRACKMMIRPVT
ncbi:fibrinogen-like protein A [Mizuhopecten yessoensis]|nr:fibrinogen-like protein A [Mizuhopecten yessoensis]